MSAHHKIAASLESDVHLNESIHGPACRRTQYATMQRAREVLFIMTQKGINTSRLHPIFCKHCGCFHVVYKPETR